MKHCNRRIYDTLCGRSRKCKNRIDFKEPSKIGSEQVYGYCDDIDIHYATREGVKI